MVSSELQEVFLIEFVEESTQMLHVLHDHSSVGITVEMPDFDLHWQFQTRLSYLLHRAL